MSAWLSNPCQPGATVDAKDRVWPNSRQISICAKWKPGRHLLPLFFGLISAAKQLFKRARGLIVYRVVQLAPTRIFQTFAF